MALCDMPALQRLTVHRPSRSCIFVALAIMFVAMVLLVLQFREDPFCKWKPTSVWDERSEQELRANYAIGIISSKLSAQSRLNMMLKSWLPKGRDAMAEVFTDSNDGTAILTRPSEMRFRDTGCPASYTVGLWCKNMVMLRAWKTEPRYKDVKWFFRAMDDSFVHLENLMWLTKQYDHNEPVVIAEKVCYWTGVEYPDGGPGFVMSRKFVDMWTEEVFNKTFDMHEGETIDDLMWGQLLERMNVKMVHYPGIMHAHLLDKRRNIYRYFMKHANGPWPLKFRPIAYHQGVPGGLEFLPKLTYDLHQIDYDNVHPEAREASPCDCGKKREISHGRCSYAPKYPFQTGRMSDFGPGPWL